MCFQQIPFELFTQNADNNTMKHLKVAFCLVILMILALPSTLWADDAQKADIFFFHWALGTSAVVYGDEEVEKQTQAVIDENTGRFILSADIGLSIALDKRIRLITGAILTSDLTFNTSVHANRLDYAFFMGIRVFPNLAGFNFGIDYTLGGRADFVKLPGQNDSSINTTPWGNGFRVNIGYDFSYHGSRFAPLVQGSYRMMPRGGSFDHYFSLFINFHLPF